MLKPFSFKTILFYLCYFFFFKSGALCEFQNVNDNTADLQWTVGKPYPYSIDHTTSTNASQFAYVNLQSSAQGSKARLESATYPSSGVECVQFWYMFEASVQSVAEINVYEKHGSSYGTAKWNQHAHINDPSWTYGQVEIGTSATSDYSVVFEAYKRQSSTTGPLVVGLDDINIKPGQCRPAVNCDFEDSNICSWKQHDQNQINWLLNRGQTDSYETGPHVDVTLGTADGTYLYIETSSPTKPGDKAILVSEYLDPTTSGSSSCFGMWYFMYGLDVGELSVWINDTQAGLRLLRNFTGEQGFTWHPLFINITNSMDFRIAIRGVVS